MYQALYRKWRPKTFDDVVGQEHITTTLKNEVARQKPSHAYLFCGTRGTGKTSCSKILAKAVNCLNPQNGNPCCACEICRGIESDVVLDITEIDAASNSGVDNIRDLREEATFLPARTKYRIYIIDEAHMLSTGAFNALLKIIEEPPAHVLFILATTEIHKVPATILSRCQRFDFRRLDTATISERLLYIAAQEGVSLQPDAAGLIARLADGGLRDAISLFDLCLSDTDTVTADVVRSRAGLVGQSHLFDFAQAIAAENAGTALALLQALWEQSVDYQRLCEQIIGFYRNVMVAKTVNNPTELIACLPDELEQYRLLAAQTSLPRIFQCLGILEETLARMARTTQRRTELEMGLIKLCTPLLDTSPAGLLRRLEQLEQQVQAPSAPLAQPPVAPAQVAVPPPTPEPDEPPVSFFSQEAALPQAPQPQPEQPKTATAPVAVRKEEPPAPPAVSAQSQPVQNTPASPLDDSRAEVVPFVRWGEVLDLIAKNNKALHGHLVHSSAYISGTLLLVDAGELFAQMVRGNSYAKDSLRDAVEQLTGTKYRLGPYRPERYQVKQDAGLDQLESLLMRASDLGINMDIKE